MKTVRCSFCSLIINFKCDKATFKDGKWSHTNCLRASPQG